MRPHARETVTRLRALVTAFLAFVVAPVASVAQDAPSAAQADVERVAVTGSSGSYLFQVTVRSPDRGCAQYANWWEILSAEGELIYRRVLKHSHVGEQPFTRSLSGVRVPPETTHVIVRTHDSVHGYGGAEMKVKLP